MLQVNFKSLQGNNAPVKVVKNSVSDRSKELAAAVIDALLGIDKLDADEREALKFVQAANGELQFMFAQCKTQADALNKYTHYADFGEKRFFSIDNKPTNLFELLANLSTGHRLYKAVKIVSAQANKPKTFDEFIAEKRLPAGVVDACKGLFIEQYIDYCNSLQLSQGTISDLLKQAGLAKTTTGKTAKTTTRNK